MTLKNMKPGQIGIIEGFKDCSSDYKRRLMTMGLLEGTNILFKRTAPFGCPVIIAINGFQLALRKAEANALKIKVIS